AAPRCCFAARPDELAPGPLGVPANVSFDMSDETFPQGHLDYNRADDRPLLIIYTSGTTGAPKGAVITAAGVAANLDALAAVWGWTAEDTVVHALPLFHVHGLVLGLFGSLRVGGCMRWLPRFDPVEVAAALDARSVLFAVPTMYVRLADAAERDPAVAAGLGAARLLISGSAPLAAREHRRIAAATGRGVYERYGLTETLIVCAVPARGPARPGFVGPPLPGVEVVLVDDERGPLPEGDPRIGEVAVRGPSVFAGYLGRPDATAAVLDPSGWFYTGDLAVRAPDGALQIVGRRATDLIKSGGFKIGAGEIEACLLEHPGVLEVAVVGVPDDDLGERIVAFVVPADPARPPAPAGLIDHVAATLAPHKRPREVRFLDALPRNAMGKVLKPALVADAPR
ncbi:MAG TPA: AMP-binding protein, partial [Nannocystis sp.]